MATEAFQRFLEETEEGAIRETRSRIAPEQDGPLAPTNISETFSRGLQAGAQGLRTDIEYFKALGNTLTGDENAAAKAIEQARYSEELSAPTMAGMETFGEFLDQPTFSGFLNQAASAAGQIVPSVFTTIAGAGVGGITAAAGKGVLSKGGRLAAQRIIKDSLERTAKGVADPQERYLANEYYKYFRAGAVTGAFGAEYAPLSGGNLSEALESGRELTPEEARRAALVGLPQAAIGVGGEIALLKLVGNVASRRATGASGGVFQQLANDIGRAAFKGGAIEGTTEVVQEGISVANRFDLDDEFTEEEARLRLAEAAFAGFIGGKAAGAAGGTVGSVFRQARERLNSSQEQRVDQKINDEQFGETDTGVTTPEPKVDLDAQLNAIHDPNSTKQAVWIAGEQGRERFPEDGRYEEDGKVFYTRYVPGRGTIVTKDEKLADEVVKSGADEQSLATALGYTAVKPNEADFVVEALDAQGNVVSAELATTETLEAVQENARQLSPIYQFRVSSVDQSLERRKQKLDAEGVRPMEIPDEVAEAFQVQEGEETFISSYAPRKPGNLFPGEEAARNSFIEEFGNDSRVEQFSQKLLEVAVSEQRANPNSIVSVVERDGQFAVIRQDFDKLYRHERQGKIERLPLQQFLEKEVTYAQGAQQEYRNVVLVRPDGSRAELSLVSLVNAGRNLVEGREGTQFAGKGGNLNAQRLGLSEMFADLAIEGYDLQDKKGVSLLNQASYEASGKFKGQPVVAALGPKDEKTKKRKPLTINYLMARGAMGSEVTAAVVEETVARDVTDVNALPTDFRRGQTETIRRDFDPDFDTTTAPEEDPNDITQRAASEEMVGEEITAREPTRDEVFGGNPDLRTGSAPTTGPRPYRTWRDDEIVKGVHDELQSRLQLDERPEVLSFSMLETMSDQDIRDAYLSRPNIASSIIALRAGLAARQNTYGYYDRNNNVIVIKETGNSTFDSLALAHEIGHALFRQEQTKAMANPALRTRLEAAYKANKKYESYERYENGFEEWYADQVARWATKKYLNKQARNLPERHFKKLGRRLFELFNSFSRENFRRRYAQFTTPDVTFEQYIEGMLDTAAEHTANAATQTTQQTLIPDIIEQTEKTPGANAAARAYARNLKGNLAGAIRSLLLPADNILRKVAGDEIADMFYIRSQDMLSKGKLGFLRATNTTLARWKNRFEREIGELNDPEVQAGFEIAFSGAATAELTGVARQIREYLEAFYDEYIAPSNTGIGKRPDYFPISLNLFEVTERREEFKALLLQADPYLDPKVIDKAIDRLVKLGQTIEEEDPIDPTNPAAAVEQAIKLTANLGENRGLLLESGFVNPPDAAFIDYMRHVVKRVEFNRATGGPEALQERLAELSDENRKIAEDIISNYLGYQKEPIAPWLRKLNSWGQFIQFITILPFATIASLPDLAGPVINHKDFSGLWEGFKQIAATVKNRQEAQQLARDIGVVTSETVANAWVTQAEQDYMDPTVRKYSDAYFRVIGLDFFTKFSREFASNMGVQFLLNHARNKFNNPNSTRYLDELGVTAEEVLAWNENKSFDTPEGAKVRNALTRFVESSIMRPNAAERPVWASDPRWALVWQLKGYFYSYYKTIIGGVLRESEARVGETKGGAQFTAVASVLLLTAVATMPLAMLGMELREYAKNGLAWLLPGVSADQKYFRSDKMDWGDYWFEIIEKSGFLGPLSMARMAHQNAEWGDSALFALLGPTAETIEEAFKNGWRVDRTFGNRLLPIYSQL